MNSRIIHAIIFIIVASVVIASYANYKNKPEDAATVAAMLPALLLGVLYVGVIFVMYVLPEITQKATDSVLASNEEVEYDPSNDARAAFARGDYQEAIEFYYEATKTDPFNRLHWVEISKIQHDQFEDPELAINTLRAALDHQDWPDEDDTAFFLGRIAEIQLNDLDNKDACEETLQKIIELLPETRHSANATHRLREIGRLLS